MKDYKLIIHSTQNIIFKLQNKPGIKKKRKYGKKRNRQKRKNINKIKHTFYE
jgi:hypothetical protein